MKSRSIALCFLFIGSILAAQTPPSTYTAPAITAAATPGPSLSSLAAAQKVRSALVTSIVNGSVQVDTALAQLKGLTAPMGLPVDPAADLGFAAIDVGHRLLAAGKPAEAEKFFRAAEVSLAAVVLKTPDMQAWDKAQYLQQLSLIRSHYLNNAVQAKGDIEQAIALFPNDLSLQQARALLISEHSNLFSGGTRKG
jgi:hypothetical protein